MDIQITGRRVKIAEPRRSYIEKKVAKLERFSHRITSVHVILQQERFSQIVEITVRGKDLNLIVKESAGDMLGAFDLALDRMVNAVERHEEKRKGRKRKNRRSRESVKQRASRDLNNDRLPRVIRTDRIREQPMTLEEAALTLTARNHNQFLVFENANTGQINVLYKRNDGNLGWVEPKS